LGLGCLVIIASGRCDLGFALCPGSRSAAVDYAAMGPARDGTHALAHAVADDYPETLCGLEVSDMCGVAEDFAALSASQRCPDCADLSEDPESDGRSASRT
jgi:hypothetical protein